MKKVTQFILVFFITTSTFAQYKKASFFTKSGRTFELGTRQMFISNGCGRPTSGIFFSQSLETEKKLTLYGDIMAILPGKFSYFANYTQYGGGTVNEKLSGKSPFHLYFCYGLQHRFTNESNNGEKGITPDVRVGLFGAINFASNIQLTRPDGNVADGYDFNPSIAEDASYIGLELSGGATYYFSEKFGIRGAAGYYPCVNPANISNSGGSGNSGVFNPFKSHPAITFTLKYRISSEE